MGNLIWLASYPKSGNTWMRAFLTNLMTNAERPAGINELGAVAIGDSEPGRYERLSGKVASELDAAAVAALRPKVQAQIAAELPSTRFVKIHSAMMQTAGHPSVNMQVTAGAIYIVRNPLDVALSFAHHLGSSVDDVIEKTRDQIDKLKDLKTGMMQELLTNGIGNSAFKDPPVGRIPEGGEVCMASEVADEAMVGVVSKPTQYYVDSGVPALRSANVREGGLTMENLKYFSKESNDLLKKSKLRKGDLLTVRTGYPGTTAVVTEDFEGCNCIDVVITRPSERMNSDFFSLWVNSDNGKGQVLKAQGGLAQQHFNVRSEERRVGKECRYRWSAYQ